MVAVLRLGPAAPLGVAGSRVTYTRLTARLSCYALRLGRIGFASAKTQPVRSVLRPLKRILLGLRPPERSMLSSVLRPLKRS